MSGLVRNLRPSLALLALALTACASLWPLHNDLALLQPADYLVRALTSDAAGREAMWQAAERESAGELASLHRGILRSIPGTAVYDPVAAETALSELVSQKPSADVALVARARIEDLHALNACRGDVENLKRRLSKVADIEKRLDRERH